MCEVFVHTKKFIGKEAKVIVSFELPEKEWGELEKTDAWQSVERFVKKESGAMGMWISKKKLNALEEKIAALEKEQLSIKKYVNENIKSDEELIEIVKKLRDAIQSLNPLMQQM